MTDDKQIELNTSMQAILFHSTISCGYQIGQT